MWKKYLVYMACALVLIGLVGVLPAAAGDTGRIAFVSNQEIFVMNADGTGQTQLTDNTVFDGEPSWSPDGTRIAFRSERDGGYWEIYVMNADGTGRTQLTTAGGYGPQWSPDGSKIAFYEYENGNEGPYIYVMNEDGTDKTRLTDNTGGDSDPAWSPDGSKIAFSSYRDAGGSGEIYVMTADGTGQTRLTVSTAWDGTPAWSPDGSRIAFTTMWVPDIDMSANRDICVMNADGTNPTQLTYHPWMDAQPTWSPDGTRIAYTSYRDGDGWEIYVMNDDGTGQTRLTVNTAFDLSPAWWGVVHTGRQVTGGGWITSPSGAWSAAPAMTGKATFQFNAKYVKGATVPTGQLQFKFGPAGLSFLSTGYDWLGVVGAKAQVLGSGTINGAGDYRFRLSAIDVKVLGSKKPDLFRLRIWEKGTGATVYDSQTGAGDYADPTTAVGGGSIVIHK